MLLVRCWTGGASRLSIVGSDVHIWYIWLDLADIELTRLKALLPEDEIARGDAFRTESLRRRFTVGRARVREILGAYLGREPASIRFVYGHYGKPALADVTALHFNLSHSEALAILGLCNYREVGVDVERLRELNDAQRLAARFFTEKEAHAITSLEDHARPRAFFQCWTRKEAYLKACGVGLSETLDRVETEVDRPQSAWLRVRSGGNGTASIAVRTFQPVPGYIAAVVALDSLAPRIGRDNMAALSDSRFLPPCGRQAPD